MVVLHILSPSSFDIGHY